MPQASESSNIVGVNLQCTPSRQFDIDDTKHFMELDELVKKP